MSASWEHVKVRTTDYFSMKRINPVLKDGEIVYTRDVANNLNYIKIGDGSTNWMDLPCLHISSGTTPAPTTTTLPPTCFTNTISEYTKGIPADLSTLGNVFSSGTVDIIGSSFDRKFSFEEHDTSKSVFKTPYQPFVRIGDLISSFTNIKRISMSDDGNRVAIGDANGGTSNAGEVKVFEWNASSWTTIATYNGTSSGDKLCDCKLSKDGKYLIMGTDRRCVGDGYIQVKSLSGSTQNRDTTITFDIVSSDASFDSKVGPCAINWDGTILAVGAIGDDAVMPNTPRGIVKIYKWDGSSWSNTHTMTQSNMQDGFTNSSDVNDCFGKEIELSYDGRFVIILAPNILMVNNDGTFNRQSALHVVEIIGTQGQIVTDHGSIDSISGLGSSSYLGLRHQIEGNSICVNWGNDVLDAGVENNAGNIVHPKMRVGWSQTGPTPSDSGHFMLFHQIRRPSDLNKRELARPWPTISGDSNFGSSCAIGYSGSYVAVGSKGQNGFAQIYRNSGHLNHILPHRPWLDVTGKVINSVSSSVDFGKSIAVDSGVTKIAIASQSDALVMGSGDPPSPYYSYYRVASNKIEQDADYTLAFDPFQSSGTISVFASGSQTLPPKTLIESFHTSGTNQAFDSSTKTFGSGALHTAITKPSGYTILAFKIEERSSSPTNYIPTSHLELSSDLAVLKSNYSKTIPLIQEDHTFAFGMTPNGQFRKTKITSSFEPDAMPMFSLGNNITFPYLSGELSAYLVDATAGSGQILLHQNNTSNYILSDRFLINNIFTTLNHLKVQISRFNKNYTMYVDDKRVKFNDSTLSSLSIDGSGVDQNIIVGGVAYSGNHFFKGTMEGFKFDRSCEPSVLTNLGTGSTVASNVASRSLKVEGNLDYRPWLRNNIKDKNSVGFVRYSMSYPNKYIQPNVGFEINHQNFVTPHMVSGTAGLGDDHNHLITKEYGLYQTYNGSDIGTGGTGFSTGEDTCIMVPDHFLGWDPVTGQPIFGPSLQCINDSVFKNNQFYPGSGLHKDEGINVIKFRMAMETSNQRKVKKIELNVWDDAYQIIPENSGLPLEASGMLSLTTDDPLSTWTHSSNNEIFYCNSGIKTSGVQFTANGPVFVSTYGSPSLYADEAQAVIERDDLPWISGVNIWSSQFAMFNGDRLVFKEPTVMGGATEQRITVGESPMHGTRLFLLNKFTGKTDPAEDENDPDAEYTFQLVNGEGDTDNDRFAFKFHTIGTDTYVDKSMNVPRLDLINQAGLTNGQVLSVRVRVHAPHNSTLVLAENAIKFRVIDTSIGPNKNLPLPTFPTYDNIPPSSVISSDDNFAHAVGYPMFITTGQYNYAGYALQAFVCKPAPITRSWTHPNSLLIIEKRANSGEPWSLAGIKQQHETSMYAYLDFPQNYHIEGVSTNSFSDICRSELYRAANGSINTDPTCTELQYRMYWCDGVPSGWATPMKKAFIEGEAAGSSFSSRPTNKGLGTARYMPSGIAFKPVGPLGSGSPIYTPITELAPPWQGSCPKQDSELREPHKYRGRPKLEDRVLFVSFD